MRLPWTHTPYTIMITVLPNAPFYNIFFNGLLKYQVMGEEHYCKLEECRYHISGTSVLFEWPPYNGNEPERRLIIFDSEGRVTFDGRPCFWCLSKINLHLRLWIKKKQINFYWKLQKAKI